MKIGQLLFIHPQGVAVGHNLLQQFTYKSNKSLVILSLNVRSWAVDFLLNTREKTVIHLFLMDRNYRFFLPTINFFLLKPNFNKKSIFTI